MIRCLRQPKRELFVPSDTAATIGQVEKGRKKKDIADEFGIACSSLSTISKCKAAILSALGNGARAQNKTVTAAAFPDVDKAVFVRFCAQRANKVPLSGKILQQKALDFVCMLGHDQFRASVGWFSRFKARHDIVATAISGEAAGVDPVATFVVAADLPRNTSTSPPTSTMRTRRAYSTKCSHRGPWT